MQWFAGIFLPSLRRRSCVDAAEMKGDGFILEWVFSIGILEVDEFVFGLFFTSFC
jgi:hypothetical protein